ncbi:MAG: peptidoglycan-binding protein [Rhizonema sp. PD37]|nr:peptidoglycan-binding protein [Rhizonema sp. PD37]
MDNLAYLHVAFAHEDSPNGEFVSPVSLFNKAASPDWTKLSSRAWKYMLPLVITLSVLSVVSSALALEKGDQGPSVKTLQQKLKGAGFYQAAITQVYDTQTEDAVKRFQKTVGLDDSGIAGSATIQKLDSWRRPSVETAQAKKPSAETQAKKPSAETAQAKKPSAETVANKPQDPNYLHKGDEGEKVKVLQERLRIAGFYYGDSTGIFGPITQDAVKRFQLAYNLDADGVVGPATLKKLPPRNIGYGEDAPKQHTDQDQLNMGTRGETVRILQGELIKAGYLEGEPNGYYGPYTADAVRKFQADNSLAVSGIAGPTTRAKLYSLVNTDKSEFDVQEIQRRLQSRGFYKGPLNGVMGDKTKKAIKQAQQFYGISLNDVKSGHF